MCLSALHARHLHTHAAPIQHIYYGITVCMFSKIRGLLCKNGAALVILHGIQTVSEYPSIRESSPSSFFFSLPDQREKEPWKVNAIISRVMSPKPVHSGSLLPVAYLPHHSKPFQTSCILARVYNVSLVLAAWRFRSSADKRPPRIKLHRDRDRNHRKCL